MTVTNVQSVIDVSFSAQEKVARLKRREECMRVHNVQSVIDVSFSAQEKVARLKRREERSA